MESWLAREVERVERARVASRGVVMGGGGSEAGVEVVVEVEGMLGEGLKSVSLVVLVLPLQLLKPAAQSKEVRSEVGPRKPKRSPKSSGWSTAGRTSKVWAAGAGGGAGGEGSADCPLRGRM